jgi:type IV pilus assembly protein PilB
MDRRTLKRLIRDRGLLDDERLTELEGLAAGAASSLLDTILEGGYLREEVLLPLVADEFGVDWIRPTELDQTDGSLLAELPQQLASVPHLLPIRRENGHVVVATSRIDKVESIDRLRQATGWDVRVVFAGQASLARVREGMTAGLVSPEPASGEHRSLEELANEAPIVKLVNLLFLQAISKGASDIHVEPREHDTVVRYRVDGILHAGTTVPSAQATAIVSRIKILAALDIAERRLPQDGRMSMQVMGQDYDFRVASTPTLHGEAVVLRILDKSGTLLDLDQLGFSADNLARFREQIARAHGIVLVTGPTGSGKTTTLYAAIEAIRSGETKIITIEDPVEYQLADVTQIPVNRKVGLDFSQGLRSILRLDPDIILVGEIRDSETAEIAVRAALTGHLVLATLHTNEALSAVVRLVDMGIPSFLIASTLNAVLAQRLVRRVCPDCGERVGSTNATEFAATPPNSVVVAPGCEACGRTGYKGRVAIQELLVVDEELRATIHDAADHAHLRRFVESIGMRTMRDDGFDKVRAGVTSPEEVMRVTQVD